MNDAIAVELQDIDQGGSDRGVVFHDEDAWVGSGVHGEQAGGDAGDVVVRPLDGSLLRVREELERPVLYVCLLMGYMTRGGAYATVVEGGPIAIGDRVALEAPNTSD